MEGFKKWAEKSLNRPMYSRRYRYRMATASFCAGGTGISKSYTSTTVLFFFSYFILFYLE